MRELIFISSGNIHRFLGLGPSQPHHTKVPAFLFAQPNVPISIQYCELLTSSVCYTFSGGLGGAKFLALRR
jgi:hypothetical protein